jgi:hypothetical protein
MKFVVGILALLVVLAIRQAIIDSYVDTMATVAKGGPASCLKMLGSTTAEEDGQTSIVGNLRNNCDGQVSQVTVVFTVDRGGTAYAYVRDLKPGESRRFKTMFPIPKERTYRFERITAF